MRRGERDMRNSYLPIAGPLMILPGVEGIGDPDFWETEESYNEKSTLKSRIGRLTPRQE